MPYAYVQPIPIRHDLIAAKLEGPTTYGTDAVPTAGANAVRTSQRVWSSLQDGYEFNNLRDDTANNSFIPMQAAQARGGRLRATIMWELKGLGTTYTTAAFTDADPLFQSCGWAASFNAATYTYRPITTAGARPSCSIYAWTGGKLYKGTGMRGNFEVAFRPGRLIQVRFTMEGLLAAIETDVAVPTASYTAAIPPAAIAQLCTIGPTWMPDYDEVTLRSANDCGWLYSGNAPDGLQSYDFGISRPEVGVTCRSVPTSVYSPLSDQQTQTLRALTMAWGTVPYNQGTFTDTTGLWIPQDKAFEAQGPAGGFTGWRIPYRCSTPALLLN